MDALVCCSLQIGTMKRLLCTETFALSWKFVLEEGEAGGKKMIV
jgi:hypothetical protein